MACNKTYADPSAAGILQLDQYERQLSVDWIIRLKNLQEPQVEFVAQTFRLLSGNKLIKEEKLA